MLSDYIIINYLTASTYYLLILFRVYYNHGNTNCGSFAFIKDGSFLPAAVIISLNKNKIHTFNYN